MNNNYAEANDTLTRRNSYLLAVESDEIMVSHATRANTDEASGSPTDGKIDNGNQKQKKKKAINFCRALLIPGVIVYSLSYACVKLVNYSLFFWIPYYLNQRYSWATASQSSRMSTLYDVGGIFGGAAGGWISDRLDGKRSPVVVVMLVLGIAALFFYEGFGTSPLANGILMSIAGIFVNGPAILESSAISADLGKHPAVKDDTDALATVTGIVDGTGSLGAAIGQTIIALIEKETSSWTWVFYFLMVMLAGSAFFLLKLFVCDIVSLWRTFLTKLRKKRPLQ
jgi:OPA family glycerol-3-phosphate transporter-like MFS transporter 3